MAELDSESASSALLGASGLDLDIPFLDESLAELWSAYDKLVAPFTRQLNDVVDLAAIRSQLISLGFIVEYLSLIPEPGTGDLLRARYQRTFGQETPLASFDTQTGFDYFDGGVDGTLEGSLAVTVAPVTLDVTLGVDFNQNNELGFFVGENSSLTIGGVSVNGMVDANLGIRNLLDVDVDGPLTGNLTGGISFNDPDADNKLRLSQFADLGSILREDIDGRIDFNPTLTARLPVIGALSWGGSWSATISDGSLNIGTPRLDAPSLASVEQLLRNGYQAIAAAFELFGGKDFSDSLPVAGKGLGEILGLPEFLTGGGLGSTGFQLNVTPQTVIDLINGNAVDLIRFEISGGDTFTSGRHRSSGRRSCADRAGAADSGPFVYHQDRGGLGILCGPGDRHGWFLHRPGHSR